MIHTSGNSELKRVAAFFIPDDIKIFKKKALQWAQQYKVVCALDNNQYTNHLHQREEFLLAAGVAKEIIVNENCFSSLQKFIEENDGWKFGFISYDVKNEIEKLQSKNPSQLNFPLLHFFIPEIFIQMKGNEVEISSNEKPEEIILEEINAITLSENHLASSAEVKRRMNEKDYLRKVEEVKEFIRQGDVYELNLCQEFYCENYLYNPLQLFFQLNEKSPAPFAAFYKLDEKFLLCASPERFLSKEGNKISAQPIKGTIKRSEDELTDKNLREQLFNSEKDRAENVMIVDLVRNDLSRSCKPGTVTVEELFGIYSYPRVHQMISTVSGELRNEVSATDAIKNAFPMGSMTGAPKIRAMQLIDELENTKRGLFSGTVGYFSPENIFDFNVVIRSIQYDAAKKYLSFSAGGAITIDSDAQNELEEVLLKTEAIRNIL